MQFEVKYVRQASSYDHFAWLLLDVEPSDILEINNPHNLNQDYFEGFVDGVASTIDKPHKIIILKFKIHDVDSSKNSFYRAGIEAAKKINGAKLINSSNWHIEVENRKHIHRGDKWIITGWYIDEMTAFKAANEAWDKRQQANWDELTEKRKKPS